MSTEPIIEQSFLDLFSPTHRVITVKRQREPEEIAAADAKSVRMNDEYNAGFATMQQNMSAWIAGTDRELDLRFLQGSSEEAEHTTTELKSPLLGLTDEQVEESYRSMQIFMRNFKPATYAQK